MSRNIDDAGARKNRSRGAAWVLVLSLAGMPWVGWAQAPSTQSTRSNSQDGVTVKVTPVPQVPGTATWGFKIVLDTHSQELVDDLTRTTTLVTDDGRSLKPTAWSGSGPGGHHREGVLSFAAPEPLPGAFELRVSRAGESKTRVFRWTR
ncbi:MAG: hypothetical protein OZ924_17200 [Burkholderiaceae bacterium]|nr:hypothetical protein [Burkholderiaceae bacterium]